MTSCRFNLGMAVAATLLLAPLLSAQTSENKNGSRHVFILHDGFHTALSYPRPNWAVEDMKRFLLHRGVAENDIISMACPFPRATLQDLFPRAGFEYYLNCFNPASRAAHQSYIHLDTALRRHGVRAADKLIWIGHSAGGQIGMTLAHLGGCLAKYPELANTRGIQAHPFDMVVTLGSPLGLHCDRVPAGVKQRLYYSPTDRVVHLAWVYGNLALPLLGYRMHQIELVPVPAPVRADTIVRIFHGVEHPAWPKEEHVLSRILHEYGKDGPEKDPRPEAQAKDRKPEAQAKGPYQPAWRAGTVAPSVGPGLAGLMCRALEEDARFSLEDPFENH